MRSIGRIFACALGLGLGLAAFASAQRDAVLGSGGNLYLIKAGTYGSLFPQGHAAEPDSDVLALDVVRPGGSAPERLLVPGTEGADVERLPSLLFEESSGTVFLVWERRINFIHPILMLSGFTGGGSWLDPIEILGNPFAPKNSPQLAITHDTYQTTEAAADAEPVTHHRTVLHLLWGEESNSGAMDTFYTPIFLENGTFIGRSPVYRLNDFDSAQAPSSSFDLAPGLLNALKIQNGRDDRTVVAAFTSPETRRVVTVEIDVLPAQLQQLADGARAHIIDIGLKLYPSKLQVIADKARAHIIDIGVAYHPAVVQSLAAQVYDYILASGPGSGDLQSLAEGARAHIIDIGAKLSGRGLKNVNGAATADDDGVTVEITPTPLTSLAEDPGALASHLLQIRVASSRPAPRVGAGDVSLFVSPGGQDVLLAWVEGDRVLYRETVGATDPSWRDALEIRLSDNLPLQRAVEILDQRIRNR